MTYCLAPPALASAVCLWTNPVTSLGFRPAKQRRPRGNFSAKERSATPTLLGTVRAERPRSPYAAGCRSGSGVAPFCPSIAKILVSAYAQTEHVGPLFLRRRKKRARTLSSSCSAGSCLRHGHWFKSPTRLVGSDHEHVNSLAPTTEPRTHLRALPTAHSESGRWHLRDQRICLSYLLLCF